MVSYLIRNKISLMVCDMAGTVINEHGQIYKSLFNTLKIWVIILISMKLRIGEENDKKTSINRRDI